MKIADFLFLSVVFLSGNLFSQNLINIGDHLNDFSYNEIVEYQAKKVNVLLTGTETYDSAVRNAFEKNWTFSDYVFIDKKDITVENGNNVFGLFDGEFHKDEGSSNSYVRKWYNNVKFVGIVCNYKPEVNFNLEHSVNIFLKYSINGYDEKYTSSIMGLYVRVLDFAFIRSLENKQAMRTYTFGMTKEKYSKIKDKKLLIRKGDLLIDIQDLVDLGLENYEVVDDEQYFKAIDEKQDVFIYLFIPSILYHYNYIVSAQSGEIFFFTYKSNLHETEIPTLQRYSIKKIYK